MDYLERLDSVLNEFEESSEKIAVIPKLIDAMEDMTRELQTGNESIEQCSGHISEITEQLETTVKNINKYTAEQGEFKREVLQTVSESILESSRNNMQLYNSLSSSLNSKADSLRSEIQSILKELDNVRTSAERNLKSEMQALSKELDNVRSSAEENLKKERELLEEDLSEKISSGIRELSDTVSRTSEMQITKTGEKIDELKTEVSRKIKINTVLDVIAIVLAVAMISAVIILS